MLAASRHVVVVAPLKSVTLRGQPDDSAVILKVTPRVTSCSSSGRRIKWLDASRALRHALPIVHPFIARLERKLTSSSRPIDSSADVPGSGTDVGVALAEKRSTVPTANTLVVVSPG